MGSVGAKMVKLVQDSFKRLQRAFQMAQVGPKMAQVGPKRAQFGPKRTEVGSKLPPSWLQDGVIFSILIISKS